MTRHAVLSKGFSLLIAVMLCAALLAGAPAVALADEGGRYVAHDGNTYTYTLDAGEAYITGVTLGEGLTELEIPATVDGYPVVGIENNAFEKNAVITAATVPQGVVSIGEKAFSECTALLTADLPDSLETMGFAAFYGCSLLDGVAMPKGMKSLNNSIFQNCTSLTSINIPAAVTSIPGWAFCGCTSLTDVYFNGVSKISDIGRQAFASCTSLEEIFIPKGFATISYDSFKNATALKNVYFMGDVSAVTFINWDSAQFSAFAGCTGLAFHAWDEYYTGGNLEAYIAAANAEGFNYGFSFKSLADTHFLAEDGNTYEYELDDAGDATITDVQLTGSNDLVIPAAIGDANVTELGDRCFRAMGDTVLAEKPRTHYTDITSVVMPEGLEVIGKEAFYANTSVVSIDIPSTVTVIRSGAFCYCPVLEELVLPEGLTGSIGDIFCWGDYKLKSINIPEGVTSIARWAFYNCQSLTEITIPASVASIDKESFEQCYSLEKVTFAEGSKCFSIGQQVFWNDYSLKEINLPETLSFIGVETFRNCSALEKITLPAAVDTIGVRALSGCSALETVEVKSPLGYVDEAVFANCPGLTDIWFYGDISGISFHKKAFEGTDTILFHAYDKYATALKAYVDKYADSKDFTYKAIPEIADGWQKSGGNWYYAQNGAYITGKAELTGYQRGNKQGVNTYFFNEDGSMFSGFKKLDGNWYYFMESGTNPTTSTLGQMIKNYYVEGPASGYISASEQAVIDSGKTRVYRYYFGEDGKMFTGWYHSDFSFDKTGKYRFFGDKGGSPTTSRLGRMYRYGLAPKLDGVHTYFFSSTGVMFMGTNSIGTFADYGEIGGTLGALVE